MKKTVLAKAAVFAAGMLMVLGSCKRAELQPRKMEMSAEAQELLKKCWENDEYAFSEEKFPENRKYLESRSSEQVIPDVQTKNKLDLELYGNEKVYTLTGSDDYENIVFYIHGGAFVYTIADVHLQFCDLLADKLNAKVYMPLYPLAPQADYKKAYGMLKEVYADLLKQNKTIYIMGDSAGGAITLSLVQQFKAEGTKLPSKMVLIGPFVDASMTNPDIKAIEERDCQLQVYGLIECGKMWAGDSGFDDPLVCPLKGDMNGLPDTLLFNATDEVLYPDGKLLYEKMKAAGVKIDWVVGQGFWHVFPVFPIPERKECVEMIGEFVKK